MPSNTVRYGELIAGGHDVDFAALSQKLPTGMDPASKERRKQLFKQADVNGNGFLSQAEVDKAVGAALGEDLFSAKPVIGRAFIAAKDLGSGKRADYVEKSEFRLLLVYLRQYFELYLAYNRLDSSDDRRLSLPEFRKGVELLATWGIDIPPEEVESEFKTIDTNGGGIILFDEFSHWALKKQLDLEDDDDWEDDSPTGSAAAPAAAGGGKRKALLVGINYFGKGDAELDGCVHDAERVKAFLQARGFPEDASSMRVLVDSAPTMGLMPTRANILRGVDWLVRGAAAGDVLFFHFSGHGCQQPDEESTEADGLDECLVPSDHHKAGMITDDQLFDRLVRPLPPGVRLTALMDCCHSGTGLDLPFTVVTGRAGWTTEEGPLSRADADVRLFSACLDSQESDDAKDGRGRPAGAMTSAFLKSLAAGATPPTDELLGSLASHLASAGHAQVAALSASIAHDLTKPFALDTVAAPRSADDLPPMRGPDRRPGEPKPAARKKSKTRAIAAGAAPPPTFAAPPKSQWLDAPKTRLASGSAAAPQSPGRGGGAPPLASQQYGSNLAGANDFDWKHLTSRLPTGKDEASHARRRALFGRFDFNGNGYLSLAEVDKAVRSELQVADLFSAKPVLMRAFQAAKGAAKSKSELGADYVEWPEFRLLLVYLRQYFELDVAYNRLDSSDDRRLSLPEFRKGVELLATWGIDIPPGTVESEFKTIDTNGGGIILFDEFSHWALTKHLDLEDDDDFEDGTKRPITGGPMPPRPLSPSRASAAAGTYDEFRDPSEMIKGTKPRVLGGGFAREARLNPPRTVNPLDSSGGKSVNRFPWSNRDAGVFPASEPRRASRPAGTLRSAKEIDQAFRRNQVPQPPSHFAVDTSLGSTAIHGGR